MTEITMLPVRESEDRAPHLNMPLWQKSLWYMGDNQEVLNDKPDLLSLRSS